MGSRATGGMTKATSGTTTRQNEGDGRHNNGKGQYGDMRHDNGDSRSCKPVDLKRAIVSKHHVLSIKPFRSTGSHHGEAPELIFDFH